MNELEILHDAMTATLKDKFPEVVRLEAFPDLEQGISLPALFFGLSEFVPGPDSGTGKTAIHGKFQAVILVDPLLPHAALQAMWLGTRLASNLRGQYWGLDFVDATQNVKAAADASNPDLATFVVWVVDWEQVFHVGDETPWPWPDDLPTPVHAELVEGLP